MKKISQYLTIGLFSLIILALGIYGIIQPDKELSLTERRKLASFPTFTWDSFFEGTYTEDFSEYVSDQFPARDSFRTLASLSRLNLFKQSDAAGLYLNDGYIYKLDYPLNEERVIKFATKTNEIYEKYLKGKINNYYVSVIPSKEYYEDSAHLKADSQKIAKIFKDAVTEAEYLDLFPLLDKESYYRTDTHWRQEKLLPLVKYLSEKMGFMSSENYTVNSLASFYGVYYGQLGIKMEPELLFYLTSETIESAKVTNLQKPEVTTVYDYEAYDSLDRYDIYLSGASPLITIENPNDTSGKELVIFRDSYTSSLAPLLIEGYKSITLVDLRYMSSDLLTDYIDFTNKDVLVIYSSLLLNSTAQLKWVKLQVIGRCNKIVLRYYSHKETGVNRWKSY